MPVTVRNLATNSVLADRADIARTLLQRLLGLLPRRRLEAGEALVIPRCRSIHTCFMRFPIDAVFLRQGTVVKVVAGMGAFRLAGARGADTVVELPAGTVERLPVQAGNRLELLTPS